MSTLVSMAIIRAELREEYTVLFSHISMHNTNPVTAIAYQAMTSAMTLHRPEISVPGIMHRSRHAKVSSVLSI